MALDLSSLEKAIISLKTSINVSCNQEFMSNFSDAEKNTIQAGVIQNFEVIQDIN